MKRILIVEDEPVQQQILAALVGKKLGYEVAVAGQGKAALAMLAQAVEDEFSLVLLDVMMPEMDGFAVLRVIREKYPALPVLMLTAKSEAALAVKAIKEGAVDYIVKPPDANHLAVAIQNALRLQAMAAEIAKLRRDKEGTLQFSDLVGYQAGLAKAVAQGRRAAITEAPVLLMGETGVGKELFARAIHGEGTRAGGPFIAVNCGAIPENLVESTLFGHEKGAFTGAISKSLGKFREAEGGTLFLDEVSELPVAAQVKLLRVLQQKEVEPVGAGRALRVDVRIISATNRDLRAEVKAGRFREDLYFRLHVLPLAVPPLRERGEDIVTLAGHFLEHAAAVEMLPPKQLAADALDYLRHASWPGNVRELENLMRRVLVLCEESVIHRRYLQAVHEGAGEVILTVPAAVPAPGNPVIELWENNRFKSMARIEAEAMQRALAQYDGNITHAAAALGIAKSTFYRKVKEQQRGEA